MHVPSSTAIRSAILAAAVWAAVCAAVPLSGAQASMLDDAKQRGSVVVGLANEKPYAYIETDGTVTGAIIEVLRAAMKPMGIDKIEANINEFSALVPGVVARRFDIIGAGMYVTPKRCEAIAFTNPITRVATVLAAKAGNPKNIHSLEDIAANPELKVGSQLGTAQVDDLHRAGIPEDRIVLFSRDTEGFAGLQADRVDAIYYPALEIGELIKKSGSNDVERVEPFEIAKGDDGKPLLNFQSFGFNKQDADFVDALNGEIAKLRQSGDLARILEPYGFTAQDVPDASMTAAAICAGS
jgi:polar amino acid transport system substrate-binding protein